MTRRSVFAMFWGALFSSGCALELPSSSDDQYEIQHQQIKMRRALARSAPSWGYSGCASCKLPWWVVSEHAVNVTEFLLLFAVCQQCWMALGPAEAWPFYRDLVRKNYPGDTAKEEQLKFNVFGGGHGYVQPVPAERKS